MGQLTKFSLEESKAIRDYYDEWGYAVIRNVVPTDNIERFMDAYRSIRSSPAFVYYSQSRQIALRPKTNKHGFIQESMQNASRLAFFPQFAKTFQSCIYHDGVADSLSIVTGEEKHVSWQNMFFDQSTGTVDHQDSWYLDTDPPGHLVGVWYALEDIEEDSGPFFVSPGSHKIGLIERSQFPAHADYVNEVQSRMTDLSIEQKPMPLKRGDILIWHAYLIHGALGCKNASHSRKSFTSHFYPYGLRAKDTESEKKISIYDHQHPRPTSNPRLFSAYRFNDYIYNMFVYGLYAKHKMLSVKSRISMRREDYA